MTLSRDPAKEVLCLACQRQVAGPVWCENCAGLCEPGMAADYFTCLGLRRSLQLDLEDLEKRFYEGSKRLHPDRFAARSIRERKASETFTSRLNQAYRCLKDPMARATYLIELEGIKMAGEGSVPQELAEEYFEMQEARDDNPAALPGLKAKLEERAVSYQKEFARLCGVWQPGDTGLLRKIAAIVNAQNYLRSMLRDMGRTG